MSGERFSRGVTMAADDEQPRRYNRSSQVFPDSLKSKFRDVLVLYRAHLAKSLGRAVHWQELRDKIMKEVDHAKWTAEDAALKAKGSARNPKRQRERSEALHRDDLRKWCHPAAKTSLGDAKFQYVDAFIRNLDRSSLPDEILTLLRSQSEEQNRDALGRFFRESDALPGSLGGEQMSGKAYGKVYAQSNDKTSIGVLTPPDKFHPVRFLLFVHRLIDGLGSVDLAAVIRTRDGVPFSTDDSTLSPSDPADRIKLYTGQLIVTTPGDAQGNDASGIILLKQTFDTAGAARLPAISLPPSLSVQFTYGHRRLRLIFPADLGLDKREGHIVPWLFTTDRWLYYESHFETFENTWFEIKECQALMDIGRDFAFGWRNV